jgi:ABC-type uncharacterized transport system substrate-binding protein
MPIGFICMLALSLWGYPFICNSNYTLKKAVEVSSSDGLKIENFDPRHRDKKCLKIFIITWRGNTEAENSFSDRLQELGHEVEYSTFDAGQSTKALINFLSTEFSIDGLDYVYTFGTSASLLVAEKLKNLVPQVFNVVSFPEKCGLINRNSSHNGGNLSGVKCYVPMDKQIDNARKFLKFKTLGVLVSLKEKNSIECWYEIEEVSRKSGFQVNYIGIDKKKNFSKKMSEI